MVKYKKIIRCYYCFRTNIYWKKMEDNKWRLFNNDGSIHRCKGYKKC
jgi:hypothetical protein